jgi:Ubiquitin-activating enzyme E1 FCCH domain
MFWGFVQLGNVIKGQVILRNGSNVPTDATGLPAFRVYGPNGLMTNGTGSLALKDPSSSGGTITGATNASPIVVTSAGHGLSTGTQVTIAGVTGNTNANGNFVVTVVDSNTFSLNGSTGNSAYVSGGTWHVSGLYEFTLTPSGANGFVQGTTYSVLVTSTVSATVVADLHSFTVV